MILVLNKLQKQHIRVLSSVSFIIKNFTHFNFKSNDTEMDTFFAFLELKQTG